MFGRGRYGLAAGSVLVLLAAGLVGGCATVGKTSTGCGWLKQEATGRADSAVAVLVDRTASMWGGRTGNASDWSAKASNALLADASEDGTRTVSLGWFDGSLGAPHWLVNNAPLPEVVGNDANVKKQKEAFGRCLGGDLSEAQNAAAVRPGTDVLSALSSGAAELSHPGAARRRLVVITDGLPNHGCLDLRTAAGPGELTDRCQQTRELRPGMLRGVDLRLVGVGYGASAVSNAQREWLTGLWRRVCAVAGAGGPCVDDSQPPGAAPRTPGHAADDPEVTPPTITIKSGVADVPASLLFATDSARIGADAQSVLAGVIGRIRKSGAHTVTVEGHTDSRGTTGHNLDLSKRRAGAVADVLRGAGITVTTVKGYGEAKPLCDERRGGAPCMARDRRVRITYNTRGQR